MKFLKKVGSGVALVASTVGIASAALPEGVTTALSDAKTDGLVVAGAVLGVIIAIGAFKYIRKAL